MARPVIILGDRHGRGGRAVSRKPVAQDRGICARGMCARGVSARGPMNLHPQESKMAPL